MSGVIMAGTLRVLPPQTSTALKPQSRSPANASPPADDSKLTAAEVTFEPGSRTYWHNHPAGQYLIVTAGT